MNKLTFERRAARDRLVFNILGDITYFIQYHDANLPDQIIEFWKERAITHDLSKAAVSQTVEEVRQVLDLMSKLNEKRVP